MAIRIDLQNPTDTSVACWMMLERIPIDPNRLHCIGITPGMYLRTLGFGLDGHQPHYSELTLLDTNEPTILAGLYHYVDNSDDANGAGDNFRYLEGDYRIYYGQSSTAEYRSSGMEDFYHSSWYFQEGPFDKMDEALVLKNEILHRTATNRFFPLNRAPAHPEGIKFTWQIGEPAMPDPCSPYVRWLTWYYK